MVGARCKQDTETRTEWQVGQSSLAALVIPVSGVEKVLKAGLKIRLQRRGRMDQRLRIYIPHQGRR